MIFSFGKKEKVTNEVKENPAVSEIDKVQNEFLKLREDLESIQEMIKEASGSELDSLKTLFEKKLLELQELANKIESLTEKIKNSPEGEEYAIHERFLANCRDQIAHLISHFKSLKERSGIDIDPNNISVIELDVDKFNYEDMDNDLHFQGSDARAERLKLVNQVKFVYQKMDKPDFDEVRPVFVSLHDPQTKKEFYAWFDKHFAKEWSVIKKENNSKFSTKRGQRLTEADKYRYIHAHHFLDFVKQKYGHTHYLPGTDYAVDLAGKLGNKVSRLLAEEVEKYSRIVMPGTIFKDADGRDSVSSVKSFESDTIYVGKENLMYFNEEEICVVVLPVQKKDI